MEILWLAILGFLLTGYFVLGGYDYGVQMLFPLAGRDRRVLAALGPFFFGNEVWLIAFGGVLFGAFPFLEGTLLSGLYPLIVTLLLGLAAGKAAVQLRGRTQSRTGRAIWDVLIASGGLIPALVLGSLIGLLLTGVGLRGGHTFDLPPADLFHPFVLLSGLTMVLILAGHGGAFLALRATGDVAAFARSAAGRALAGAAVSVAVAFAAGALLGIRPPNPGPATVTAALIAALLLAGRSALRAGRSGLAFAATSAAAGLPVVLAGLATYPYLLASSIADRHGITVTEAAADGATLQVLTAFGVVIIPVILAYQAFSWWVFRGRVDAPDYF